MVMDRSKSTQISDTITIGIAQIAPIWLNRDKTISKVERFIHQAGEKACDLIVFGEALVPGYPFWVERTDGARFNNKIQKEIYAHYLDQGVQISAGDLDSVCEAARKNELAVYLGTIERPDDRGGHSLYCSLIYIDPQGIIQSVHRKLQPTYEERLVWASGDGHGLQTHSLGKFHLGGLNCWENWMPLSRAALYGLGEDLHIAVWPGSKRNTHDITCFIAKESRSYVASVSGLLHVDEIPDDIPHSKLIKENSKGYLADGGSCLAGPDGEWIIEPLDQIEQLVVAQIDHQRVREERQNFDPAGHYSRPDVTHLILNRKRQGLIDPRVEIDREGMDEDQAL
jgi:nitrilase